MSIQDGAPSQAADLQNVQAETDLLNAETDLQLRNHELRVKALKLCEQIAEKGDELTKLRYDYTIRHAQLHNADAERRLARIVAYRQFLAANKEADNKEADKKKD